MFFDNVLGLSKAIISNYFILLCNILHYTCLNVLSYDKGYIQQMCINTLVNYSLVISVDELTVKFHMLKIENNIYLKVIYNQHYDNVF